MGGYYTYIDLKAVMQKAGLEYHENENLLNEPPRHLGVVRNKLDLPESELVKGEEVSSEVTSTAAGGKKLGRGMGGMFNVVSIKKTRNKLGVLMWQQYFSFSSFIHMHWSNWSKLIIIISFSHKHSLRLDTGYIECTKSNADSKEGR